MDNQLIDASVEGNLSKVKELLSAPLGGRGADPNSKDIDNYNALYWAAHYNHPDVISELILNGADPNILNPRGVTALYNAVYMGNLAAVEELFKHPNVNPNISDIRGETPLIRACTFRFLTIVKVLLSNGADPNITNHKAKSALHYACWYGYLEIVNELLLFGADPTLGNGNRTPVHLAMFHQHGEITKTLNEYFPSLLMLSVRRIRQYKIDVSTIPEMLSALCL